MASRGVSEYLTLLPSACFTFVMIGGVLAFFVYSSKQRAQMQIDTAQYQAGAMAQRLGMRLERGEPHINLFVNQSAFANQTYDVVLRGERNGVPIELIYLKQVWVETHLMSATRHRKWQGQLTARTGARFGHFEVTLRHPQTWNAVRPFFSVAMQEVMTGNARTDSMLRVTTDNPAIAGPLGALLEPLTRLNYVHVIGRDGEVTFLVSHAAVGQGNEMIGVGYALHDAEVIYDILTRIVLVAEGRG